MADDANYRDLMAHLEAVFARGDGEAQFAQPVDAPSRMMAGAGAQMGFTSGSLGMQGDRGSVTANVSGDEAGMPAGYGVGVNAGPVGYQQSRPMQRGAPAQHSFRLNLDPKDVGARLQAILNQSPGGRRSYGVGTGGEGWGAQAVYDPHRKALQISGGLERRFSHGGSVPGYAEGGLMERLRNLFKGDDYQSTGQKTVRDGEVNWGDPDSAADFFRADKARTALDKARSSVANIERASAAPLPPRRPMPEAAPAPDRGDFYRTIPGAQPPMQSERFEPFPGAKPTPYGALNRIAQQPQKPMPYSRWPIANDRYRDVNDWTPAEVLGLMRAKRSMGETVTGYAKGGPALPSFDPMGSFTGMEGLDQEGREPGLYERLADEMAATGMAVGEPIRQAAAGISDIPGAIGSYVAETSQKPDPSQRMAEDIRKFGSAFADQAMSSPTEFAKTVGGFIPGIGEAISAYDAKYLYGDLQKAEAEGDTGKADMLRRLYGLASAGAIPGAGMAARVAGKVKQGAVDALKIGERGAGHALESAIEREAGHIPLELGDLKYATSQEGPFYRVRSPAADEFGSAPSGIKETVEHDAGIAPSVGGGSGPAGGGVPKLLSDEELQTILKSPEQNRLMARATAYTGADFEPVKMAPSSLAKQSAIGRTFEIASEGSPEYKASVFEAYKREMPDVVRESGATNYDELLAASYKQMAKETKDQFDSLPLSYSFHKNGEGNYASSAEMAKDVHGNGHLYVFQGGDPHDFLHNVDPRTGLNENEMFRAVHDAYGHAVHGNQFGAKGEEIAWGLHQQMYSPLAKLAMTAETRGQNSFVNYTPINAKLKERLNGFEEAFVEARRRGDKEGMAEAAAAKKEAYEGFQYAPQKAVLLPPEFVSPEYTGGMPAYLEAVNRPRPGTTVSAELTHFSPAEGLTELDPARYGTGIPGDERSRLIRKSGERVPGSVPERTYFYTSDPEKVIPEAGLGQNRYRSSSDSLYDIVADPLDFKKLARESLRNPWDTNFNPGMVDQTQVSNALDRLVKEYGYEGMVNQNAAFPMATVFKPKAVEPFAQGGSVRGYATGGPADDQIEALYNKYTGRSADPEGRAYWQSQLAGMSPEEQDAAFLKGANAAYAANAAAPGPVSDAQIKNLYQQYAGREADQGGLEYWKQKAAAPGATYADLSNQFRQDVASAGSQDQVQTVKAPAWLEKFDYENFDNPLDAGLDYLKRTLGDKAAAALYGNFNTESYANPQQLQTAGGPNGRPLFDRFTNMPLGMGLAQWSPERQNNLYKFADKYGVDPNSTEGQLRFAVNELTTNPDYSKWLNRLQQPNVNVAGATQIIGKRYEAPARLQQTIAERKAAADLFSRYMNKGTLTPEEQGRIASIKGGVKDPMFAAKLAARQAPTQVATKPATNNQMPGSADILGDTGFNPVVDTSVNDRIMQDANDRQQQLIQNSLNYNGTDPNSLFNSYMNYPTTSFSSGGVPGGMGGADSFTGLSYMPLSELPGFSDYSPYAEGGAVGYAEGGSFRPMFEGDSEMLQARAKQLAKQAYSDPRSLSSEDMKEWNLLAGRYNLPFSAQNPMSYEDEVEQRNNALERNLSAKERRRTYAQGGAVDAYDPAEIDAIAAQIRGAA